MIFAIPASLTRRISRFGPDGQRWIASLPDLVTGLAERWGLSVDGPPCGEGQCALVLPVRGPDGSACVLKISWPFDCTRFEGPALRFWDGRGAVRVLASDDEQTALLLERCEPGTTAWSSGDVLGVMCATLRRLWRPAPTGDPFLSLAGEAVQRADGMRRIFREKGCPVSSEIAEAGATAFEELAASTTDPVLVHGDFHPENVLASGREPWLVIDPQPHVGDRAFDTAQLLLNLDEARGWPSDPAQHAIAIVPAMARLAGLLELDVDRIKRWYFGRCVEEVAWSLQDGESPDVPAALSVEAFRICFG